MTRDEAYRILRVLQANYADTFKDMSDDAISATVDLWQASFTEPYNVVANAVVAYMTSDNGSFMPKVGQIKQAIYKQENTMTEAEAWGLVSRACENGYYGYKEEFEKLPPMVQKAVGTAHRLKEWSIVPASEFQTVVASNFQRAYRAMMQREEEDKRIPPNVKAFLTKVSQMLAIGNGENNQLASAQVKALPNTQSIADKLIAEKQKEADNLNAQMEAEQREFDELKADKMAKLEAFIRGEANAAL